MLVGMKNSNEKEGKVSFFPSVSQLGQLELYFLRWEFSLDIGKVPSLLHSHFIYTCLLLGSFELFQLM